MQIWGGRDSVEDRKTSFLSHSKNIMLKRKARKAPYRTVGMTQRATEWQPVWAKCCSGKTETFSLVLSDNQALKKTVLFKKMINFNSQNT